MSSINVNLRVSTLPHWNDCPRRGSTRLFRKLIKEIGYTLRDERRNVSAAVGTGAHAGAHHILLLKQKGLVTKVSDSIEIGIVKFKQEAEKGLEYDGTTANRNEAEHQIGTITKAYYQEIAPQIEPIDMEVPLKAKIPNNDMILTLSGHPDVIELKKIRDTKTGRSVHQYPAQLGGYHMLAGPINATWYDRLIIDWLPRVPVKKPYPGAQTFEMPVKTCIAEAKAVIMAIKNQTTDFLDRKTPMSFPANPSSILCSEKYCLAYGTDYCEVSNIFNRKD